MPLILLLSFCAALLFFGGAFEIFPANSQQENCSAAIELRLIGVRTLDNSYFRGLKDYSVERHGTIGKI